ncbi:MAG: hypothetical protein HPY44_21450 [Armatimonadetes bacterium]|nr:hypothetical protein [Armatimonadota bacterium]
MHRLPPFLIVLALLAVIIGCSKKEPAANPVMDPKIVAKPGEDAAADATQSGKIKVTAYINVSSGCQAPTVDLVNNLGMDYADLVDLEIVNFGSPEGERRWREDGLDCMAILFDKGEGPSPALKFPGRDGKEKTVVFFMPAGFSWEHEDLEDAFKAMKDGTLQILSEEEARKELEPKEATITTSFKEEAGKGQVLIGDAVVITVEKDAGDVKAIDRAKAAAKVLGDWAQKPVHPSQVKVEAKDKLAALKVGETTVIEATQEDAKAAGVKGPKALATQWAEDIRKAIVTAVRE